MGKVIDVTDYLQLKKWARNGVVCIYVINAKGALKRIFIPEDENGDVLTVKRWQELSPDTLHDYFDAVRQSMKEGDVMRMGVYGEQM